MTPASKTSVPSVDDICYSGTDAHRDSATSLVEPITNVLLTHREDSVTAVEVRPALTIGSFSTRLFEVELCQQLQIGTAAGQHSSPVFSTSEPVQQ